MSNGSLISLNGSASTPVQQPPKPGRGMVGAIRDFIRGTFSSKPDPNRPIVDQLKEEISKEHLASGPRGVVLPWFLPRMDDYTGETARMRLAYREMLKDPNVKAALLDKLFSVASLELHTTPATMEPKDKNDPDFQNKLDQHLRDKRGADFVKDALTKSLAGGVRKLVESIAYGGLIDGYSVSEKIWEVEQQGQWAGKTVLRKLKSKDTHYDLVPEIDEFRNVVAIKGIRYNAGELFNPSLFVYFTYLPLFENPAGQSDLRAAYSRYWLLDTVLKLRAVLAEKRAMPLLIGQYATAQQAPSLEAALQGARYATWASIPQQSKIEAINIAGQADDIFASFVKDLKHDIFLSIAGAVLQALEGTMTDARGSSQVHQSTSELLKWYLSAVVTSVIQAQIVPDLISLNFVNTGFPTVTLSAIDENELQAAAKIDQFLHDVGMDLSKEDLYKRYGRTPPMDEEDKLAGAPPKQPMQSGWGNSGGNGMSIQKVAERGVSAVAPFSRFSEDDW